MARFLIKRLLNMIPLIIGITFLSFLVMSLVPGNFLSNLKLNPAISPQVIHQMEAQFGLDQPLLVRYAKWLWEVLHLNLGLSMSYRVNVTSLIAARAFNTVILAAGEHDLRVDRGDSDRNRGRGQAELDLGSRAVVRGVFRDVGAELLSRLPDDVPGADALGWFPVGGTFSLDYEQPRHLGQRIADRINHLILPVFVLGVAGMASLMRLMRSQILEIKNSEFVRTARAKGLPERVVMYKHVLRNALNPFVTLAGYGLADLLGGAALIEAVMNLQGLGLLLLDAVRSLDIYLVMGSVLMGTVLLLLGNLLADIALVAVDPRVDFSSMSAE